jgi:opacity protein-like surface antigen
MRKVLVIGMFLLLCGAFAVAQNAELAGGWNYLHVDTDAIPSQNSIPGGFFIDGTYYFARLIGVTGDFQYGKKTFSSDLSFTAGDSARAISFHAGPRVKVRVGGLEPFAHVLFGFTNLQLAPSGSLGFPSESATKFSMKLGGGIDVKLVSHFAVRLAEVNYYRTTFSPTDFTFGFPGPGTKDSQNNFTFGAGLVVR